MNGFDEQQDDHDDISNNLFPFPCFAICCGKPEDKKGDIFTSEQKNHERHSSTLREKQITLHSQSRRKQHQQHRKTVYNHPIDIQTCAMFEPPKYPKPEHTIQFIDAALLENFIFAGLTNEERRILIDAMQSESVAEGTTIIHQGEEGDFFYVVEQGTVDFVADEKFVGNCTSGSCFGELALLYNSPRAATCKAATDCKLWKVDQHTFRKTLTKISLEEEQDMTDILKKVRFLSHLDAGAMSKFSDALTTVTFREGERIINKGDVGEVFYILREGTVNVHDIGFGDSQYVDQALGPGDWFGERALLTGEPRVANVTATSDCTTLCLSRDTFEQVFGPLDLIVNKELRKRSLTAVPIFHESALDSHELDQLVDLTVEECFRKGDVLEERGKPISNNLYMIRYGRILAVNEDGTLNTFKTGDYYGDEHIKEERKISTRTVTMEENTCFGVLSKSDIVSVIGNIGRLGESLPYVSPTIQKSIKLSDVEKHQVLGKGAFGKVWLVSHKQTKTPYALKALDKRHLITAKQTKAVVREKTIMSGLEHPFILNMVSSFQDENYLYILTGLVQGGELFNILHTNRSNGISNDSAVFYGACVIEALGHMHKRIICYRDLKPENVLLDAEGYCVIVDLGFAKIVVNKTYTLCGTPEYLAPEILRSKGHSKAVDYWAFGILVYEMLAGTTPFYRPGESQMDLFKRIVIGKYEFPTEMNEDGKDLISKLLVRAQTARLGNLANGCLDIQQHPWFKGINFKKLNNKQLKAPWTPDLKNGLDSSHFDDFSHEENDERRFTDKLSRESQDLFKDF